MVGVDAARLLAWGLASPVIVLNTNNSLEG